MKTLLALLITMSFAFSAQASAQNDAELTAKLSTMLDDANTMLQSELRFKQLITVNVLESLANSNIDDPELIKRVIDSVANLEQAFSSSQRVLVKKSLAKLNKR